MLLAHVYKRRKKVGMQSNASRLLLNVVIKQAIDAVMNDRIGHSGDGEFAARVRARV